MAHNPTSKGFGLLQTLAIIVVVLIIGTTGWLVYQHNKTKPADAATKNQHSTKQKTDATKPSPTVGYLNIKEWGVRLPLSAQIKDAYYVVSTSFSNDPDGLPSGVWLGVRSLSNSNTSCDASNNNKGGGKGAIGAILRVPSDYKDPVYPHKPYTQEYPNGVTIGTHYYAYQSWHTNNPCASGFVLRPFDSAFADAARYISPTNKK